MRIAISGSHRTGKSTLLAALSRHLPTYTVIDEPYALLEEDGHEFAHPPSLEDFQAQLQRSLEELDQADGDVLFDRCPLDFLGYIAVHEDNEAFELDEWLPRVQEAIATLDLLVFVPIEARDPIAVSRRDDGGTPRADVDGKLKEILFDDPFGLDVDILEVAGDPEARARAVLQRIQPAR